MKDYLTDVKTSLATKVEVRVDCIGESEFQRAFENYVANPRIKLAQVLRSTLKREHTELQKWGTSSFISDILIKDGNKPIFFAEMKHPDLKDYIKDGRPKTDDPKFNRILKQVCSYFIRLDLDCAIISDFHFSIFVKLTLKEDEVLARNGKVVTVPLAYKFIGNEDHGETLQAIVASLIYDELVLKDEENIRKTIKVSVNGQEEAFYKKMCLNCMNH